MDKTVLVRYQADSIRLTITDGLPIDHMTERTVGKDTFHLVPDKVLRGQYEMSKRLGHDTEFRDSVRQQVGDILEIITRR